MIFKQIDCFKLSMKFWTIIGVWPGDYNPRYYSFYSKIFVSIFIILYNSLFTINFWFVEKKLDMVIDEMIFYFTEVACTSKVFTFLLMHEDIVKILSILESDMFQPAFAHGMNIICRAKELNVRYWRIFAGVAVTCNIAHVFIPVIAHITLSVPLELPVCSYSFLSDTFHKTYNYALYFYQSIGIHVTMWYNINIDTFILGVMILTIAQLDILDERLRQITEQDKTTEQSNLENKDTEALFIAKCKQCIVHYDEVSKFCSLIQRVFSITLFTQFSMSSYIICVCLFRFTMSAPLQYYIFLATYMTCMMLEVLAPCWLGTQIIHKSTNLSRAIYACDWTTRSRQFRSNMLFFVSRTMRPLTITGCKMFPLSLKTFTAIMNSAYSAFALLRHMQARQNE